MKTTTTLRVVVIWMVAGAVVAVLAGGETAAPAPVTGEVKRQTICPVMGGAVNTNLYVDADGKRIYLCCKGCEGTVKKDPATYIKALEADGITLDKSAPGKTGDVAAPKVEDKEHAH